MHDTTYEYDNVPYEDFAELWSAPSVGNQYQMFRLEHGPAVLSGVSGKNIDFELRSHMVVDPSDDIPLRDEEPVTESNELGVDLEWGDTINVRALALEAASRVPYTDTQGILTSARQFEHYLLEG
jgi:hypothetical protein